MSILNQADWYAGNSTNNPNTNAILADTGNLALGFYEISIYLTTTANAAFSIILYDNGGATVKSFGLRVLANSTFTFNPPGMLFFNGHGIKVQPAANITGNAQVAIFTAMAGRP